MTFFTPRTLAERWECSEQHVRNLIDRGHLPAFRLGGKLLRVHGEDVEVFECPSGDLPDSGESGASHGANGFQTEKSPGEDTASEHETMQKLHALRRERMREFRAQQARQSRNSGKPTSST